MSVVYHRNLHFFLSCSRTLPHVTCSLPGVAAAAAVVARGAAPAAVRFNPVGEDGDAGGVSPVS
jgi:hypothetical protein